MRVITIVTTTPSTTAVNVIPSTITNNHYQWSPSSPTNVWGLSIVFSIGVTVTNKRHRHQQQQYQPGGVGHRPGTSSTSSPSTIPRHNVILPTTMLPLECHHHRITPPVCCHSSQGRLPILLNNTATVNNNIRQVNNKYRLLGRCNRLNRSIMPSQITPPAINVNRLTMSYQQYRK